MRNQNSIPQDVEKGTQKSLGVGLLVSHNIFKGICKSIANYREPYRLGRLGRGRRPREPSTPLIRIFLRKYFEQYPILSLITARDNILSFIFFSSVDHLGSTAMEMGSFSERCCCDARTLSVQSSLDACFLLGVRYYPSEGNYGSILLEIGPNFDQL